LSEHAWFYEGNTAMRVRVITRGAHASMIEFVEGGVDWQILVSNDDIEFIGDDRVDED